MKHKNRLKYKLLFSVLFVLGTIFTLPSYADKPVMGVAEFHNTSGAAWWRGGVGWELSGMLTNELANSNKFTMVERSTLEPVLREQNLAADGRISKGTGAKIGSLTGAKYLVMGTVSAYEDNVQDTGGGFSISGISIGGKKKEILHGGGLARGGYHLGRDQIQSNCGSACGRIWRQPGCI